MLDISRRSPSCPAFRVAWRWSASCPINRPYPQSDRRYNRWYNRTSSADCTADHTKVAEWVWPLSSINNDNLISPHWEIQDKNWLPYCLLTVRSQQEEDLRENHPYFDTPLFTVSRESKFRKVCRLIVNAQYKHIKRDPVTGQEIKNKYRQFQWVC